MNQPIGADLLTRSFLILASLCLICGCQTAAEGSYKLYSGSPMPAEELSIVRLGNEYNVRIDGLMASRADWAEVLLRPGEHTITWETWFAVSVLVNPTGWDKSKRNVTVDLEAGHVYELKSDRTTGHGYRMYLWVEDLTSGKVVGGVPKP